MKSNERWWCLGLRWWWRREVDRTVSYTGGKANGLGVRWKWVESGEGEGNFKVAPRFLDRYLRGGTSKGIESWQWRGIGWGQKMRFCTGWDIQEVSSMQFYILVWGSEERYGLDHKMGNNLQGVVLIPVIWLSCPGEHEAREGKRV